MPSHKVNGEWRYKSFTASTRAESLRMAAEYQACEKDRSAQRMTVRECVETYIRSRKNVLSPSTVRGYMQYAKHYKDIADIYVDQLTSKDLQFFVSTLSESRAPKTVRGSYALLLAAIRQIDERHFRVTLPANRPVEYHTPTDKDVERLLEAASPELRKAILLAAVGTLRRGEICALDYSDVLYDFSAVYVHRSAVLTPEGEIVIKDIPKTSGSVRRVVLPKPVIAALGHGEGLVYPFSPNTLTDSFVKLRKKVGLKCRFHDLRHYAASVMHAIGIPDQYIMERGGWSSDRVLKEVYRNTLEDKSVEFTKKANAYFEKNLEIYDTKYDTKISNA